MSGTKLTDPATGADYAALSDDALRANPLDVNVVGAEGGVTIDVATGDFSALGTTADAAYTSASGAAAGSSVAIEKGQYVKLAAILTKLSADPSTETTLAAVLAALGGTLTVEDGPVATALADVATETTSAAILAALASVAVTGALTDTELRAADVGVTDAGLLASVGAVDDAAYADGTGAADGSVIALLKGCFVQLATIAANTAP